ncbi:MAG: aromatic ring-hydroxylating dioxygenase subunit alpha [Deltaproteobacteria bacterium]|nr:aromatic ring-hydroxylating dioxygenase subunit alpha [Deltaproteobacteria bacterium]
MVSKMRQASGRLTEYWYAAALSEEVSTKGPVGRVVLGEMIVLWRAAGRQVVAMRDRCLHRNALLSEGDVFDGCIGCPYHGWTYDSGGRCINIPSEGANGEAPAEERRLETYPTLERDGLVWVWMGIGTEPDKAPFAMPHHASPGWGAYYMKTRFQNGVTNLVENFMDVPHTVFVHKGWFRSRSRKRVPTTVERTDHSVLVTYDQPRDSIGFTEKLLNPKGLPMLHTDKFYMPNTTRVDYVFGDEARAFVITSTCTPISEHETEVYTLISYKLGLANLVARFFLPPYTRKVIQQDVEIMEVQGRGLRHYGDTEFTSTPADTLHVHIEALRQWAESGADTAPPEPMVERMDFWI